MRPALSTIIFYGLLLLGWGILRGSLTPFPAWIDAVLAFIALAGGLVVWALGWRTTQPAARPLAGSRRSIDWRQAGAWLGLTALAVFLFLGPMSWIATRWAGVARAETAPAAKTESPRPAQNVGGNDTSGPESGGTGSEELDQHNSAPEKRTAGGIISRSLASLRELPRPWQLFAIMAALALLALLVWLALRRAREVSPGVDRADHPAGARIPMYLHEFRRLCEAWACPLDAGSTIREAFVRLAESGHTVSPLEPVAQYHYRVFYENDAADTAEERRLRRMLRGARRHPQRFRHPIRRADRESP